MNSKLYNRKAKLPIGLIGHLGEMFDSIEADANVEGYNRNKELRETGMATYQQIKRIKSWFDQYQGNKEDAPFILNGGDRMHKWCNHVLDHWRNTLETGKNAKSETGMSNQHIDSHEKDGIVVNPHDKHERGINKFDTSISEETIKIKKLISYGYSK
jgi:hypothetical protein